MRVLSFGAGVQSYTLARMSLDGELEPLDAMIFADPGAELAGTYAVAEEIRLACHNRGVDFIIVRNNRSRSSGSLFDDLMRPNSRGRWSAPPLFLINEDGTRGFTNRQCTGDFKIDPIHQHLRAAYGIGRRRKFPNGPEVEQWLGISLDEPERQKTSRYPWLIIRHPLIERMMKREACVDWLKANGYRVPPKSACFFCPYQSRRRWFELWRDHPDLWAQAVKLDKHIREHRDAMGLKGIPFLHPDRVPLTEVDFRSIRERRAASAGQGSFFSPGGDPDAEGFSDECFGACGT